jgi:hypothetical protein
MAQKISKKELVNLIKEEVKKAIKLKSLNEEYTVFNHEKLESVINEILSRHQMYNFKLEAESNLVTLKIIGEAVNFRFSLLKELESYIGTRRFNPDFGTFEGNIIINFHKDDIHPDFLKP